MIISSILSKAFLVYLKCGDKQLTSLPSLGKPQVFMLYYNTDSCLQNVQFFIMLGIIM